MSGVSVAIFGSGGALGKEVINAFTGPIFAAGLKYPIKVFTSKDTPSTDKINYVSIALDDEHIPEITEQLKGVDVVVNLMGSRKGPGILDTIATAVILAKPEVYFAPLYGHTLNKSTLFPGLINLILQHSEDIRQSGIKLVNVYNGAFFDDIYLKEVIDHVGANLEAGTFEVVDDLNHPLSITASKDVANAIASVATMESDAIPDDLYIQGDTTTLKEIVEKWEKAHNRELKKNVVSRDDALAKALQVWSQGFNPANFVYYLSSVVSLEPDVVNLTNIDNELVNPGGKFWEWTKF